MPMEKPPTLRLASPVRPTRSRTTSARASRRDHRLPRPCADACAPGGRGGSWSPRARRPRWPSDSRDPGRPGRRWWRCPRSGGRGRGACAVSSSCPTRSARGTPSPPRLDGEGQVVDGHAPCRSAWTGPLNSIGKAAGGGGAGGHPGDPSRGRVALTRGRRTSTVAAIRRRCGARRARRGAAAGPRRPARRRPGPWWTSR